MVPTLHWNAVTGSPCLRLLLYNMERAVQTTPLIYCVDSLVKASELSCPSYAFTIHVNDPNRMSPLYNQARRHRSETDTRSHQQRSPKESA
jgi:hypothetical protein